MIFGEKREQKTAINGKLNYSMSSECEIPVNRCIIHAEGKGGVQKILTNETLKTILQRRGEWLELPEDCNTRTIAATSLKFLSDNVRSVEELPETLLYYHASCYRNFTDITKLQRAKDNAKTKRKESLDQAVRTDEERVSNEHDGPQAKLQRRSRRMLGSGESSNVLPSQCLICKKSGPIYVTNPVSYVIPFEF